MRCPAQPPRPGRRYAALTVDRGATFKNAFFACYADTQRHCADVELGGGRVAACLKKSDVSPICRDAIAQAESVRAR